MYDTRQGGRGSGQPALQPVKALHCIISGWLLSEQQTLTDGPHKPCQPRSQRGIILHTPSSGQNDKGSQAATKTKAPTCLPENNARSQVLVPCMHDARGMRHPTIRLAHASTQTTVKITGQIIPSDPRSQSSPSVAHVPAPGRLSSCTPA